MERIERNGDLLVFDGSFAFSRMDEGRFFSKTLGDRSSEIRRKSRNRMEVAVDGWGDDEISAWWGKKQGTIQQIAVNLGSNEVL